MEHFKIGIYSLLWYGFSIAETVVNKHFFVNYPYPVTLSVAHMVCGVVILYPWLLLVGDAGIFVSSKNLKYVSVLAVIKLMTSVFSHTSLFMLSLSYSQTVRTLSPIIAVLLSWLIYGKRQSKKVYFAIFCIIFGVSLVTATEYLFNVFGLIASIVMVVTSTLGSFFSKYYLTKFNMHPLSLLFNVRIIAMVLLIPVWITIELPSLMLNPKIIYRKDQNEFVFMLLLQGVLSVCTHAVKFSLLSLTSSVTYSVIGAGKSVFKIIIGFVCYDHPYTVTNVVGSVLASYGLLLYSNRKPVKDKKTE